MGSTCCMGAKVNMRDNRSVKIDVGSHLLGERVGSFDAAVLGRRRDSWRFFETPAWPLLKEALDLLTLWPFEKLLLDGGGCSTRRLNILARTVDRGCASEQRPRWQTEVQLLRRREKDRN